VLFPLNILSTSTTSHLLGYYHQNMRFSLLSLLLVSVALAAPISQDQKEIESAREGNLIARNPMFRAPLIKPPIKAPIKAPPVKAPVGGGGVKGGGVKGDTTPEPPVRLGTKPTAGDKTPDTTPDTPVRLGQDPPPPKKDANDPNNPANKPEEEMTEAEKNLMIGDAVLNGAGGVAMLGQPQQQPQ